MEIWAIVGRVAVILTILTALFKFIAWWRSPKSKLVATLLPTPFKLPPTVESELKANSDRVRERLAEFLDRYPKKEGYDEAYSRAERLASEVRFAIKDELSWETRYFSGCWHVRIDNLGKAKCSGVNLRLPHALLASIQRDGDLEARVQTIKGLVNIGELRPRGRCDVVAWTDSPLLSRQNEEVSLTHDLGVGRVNGQWQTSRFGSIVGTLTERENIVSSVLFLFFIVFGLLSLALALMPLLRKTDRPSNSPAASPTPTISASPALTPPR
jgi:hypothetical protein